MARVAVALIGRAKPRTDAMSHPRWARAGSEATQNVLWMPRGSFDPLFTKEQNEA
jgi:hypothetical protein